MRRKELKISELEKGGPETSLLVVLIDEIMS